MAADQQQAIKDLLLDQRASTYIRNLMRDVPMQKQGKLFRSKQISYDATMSLFLSDPTDIENNIDLRHMESSLLLSLNCNKPTLVKEPLSAVKLDGLANISE